MLQMSLKAGSGGWRVPERSTTGQELAAAAGRPNRVLIVRACTQAKVAGFLRSCLRGIIYYFHLVSTQAKVAGFLRGCLDGSRQAAMDGAAKKREAHAALQSSTTLDSGALQALVRTKVHPGGEDSDDDDDGYEQNAGVVEWAQGVGGQRFSSLEEWAAHERKMMVLDEVGDGHRTASATCKTCSKLGSRPDMR